MSIRVKDLTYVYNPGMPGETKALDGVSLDVEDGTVLGIIGHTGSGKSTLLQHLNGLIKPDSGEIYIGDVCITSGDVKMTEIRRRVGLVFQYPEYQLFEETVAKDVAFGPKNLGYSAEKIEESVRTAMEMVHLDLDELRDRNPFELSGGQQRRVAFAGVLAMQPHTLVLDEPVAGLDPRAKRRFLDLLLELRDKQGLTVVVVSHNMDDLAELCDYVLVLNEGRLFALGKPSAVFADERKLKDVGLGVPHAVHLANHLKDAGIKLPISPVPSFDELASAIASRLTVQKGR